MNISGQKRKYHAETETETDVGSHLWTLKTTLCDDNSPVTETYVTSTQTLIKADSAIATFFDDACALRSTMLPSKVATPAQGCSNPILNTQMQNSWFDARQQLMTTTNAAEFCFQNCTASHTDPPPPKKKRLTKIERIAQEGRVIRLRKVRVKPLCDKNLLLQRFGVYRHIYNSCVANDQHIDGASSKEMSKWRTKLTKKENWIDVKPWYEILECHGRQQAVIEFFTRKKTNMAMVVQKKLSHFEMHFKSKYRAQQQCIPFERHRISRNGRMIEIGRKKSPLRFKIMEKCPMLAGRNDDEWLRSEVKLVRTRLGAYYMCIPVEIPVQPAPRHNNICALDPGCRTFQTVYGTDGVVSHVGTSFDPIMKDLERADHLAKLRSKLSTSRKRRRNKHRFLRCFERVRNRMRDLHHKVAKWLTRTYRVIILPQFKSQDMVSKGKLSHKTCRMMCTWSHYSFQQRLIEKAQHAGVKVLIANEAYTSKTCGACGKLNESLGSSKHFRCPCGFECDRDVNGARNILLRALPHILA